MQIAKNMKAYNKEVDTALNDEFLRNSLNNFAVAYRASRINAFKGYDIDKAIMAISNSKDYAIAHMDELFEQFKAQAEAKNVKIHLAKTATDANNIIGEIIQKAQAKHVIKSKSMTAEETLLNHHLESKLIEVTETDLGEWIIQLRHEGPSHMVMPAIHLSRYQVADLFSQVTREKQDVEIQRLVQVARAQLRQKFIEAEVGISGANFAIAKTGTIGIITNEGNARLTTTLPRVHIALVGLDKLTPSISDAIKTIRVLPKNATGQIITSYVTWITGANECLTGLDNTKEMHIVFLDNGRRAIAKDPIFKEALRCVRCGACANVCPVYRVIGGHKMGHIYIGAIGLINTYFYHGIEAAKNLVQNCINCGACREVCASNIDLPRLIKEILAKLWDETGHPTLNRISRVSMTNRKLFHTLLKAAQIGQKVTDALPQVRHLPMYFSKKAGWNTELKTLPKMASKAFRQLWEEIKPKKHSNPKYKIALFGGCAQDFIYPEQLIAALTCFEDMNIDVDYPMEQTCCGLPVMMMGEKSAAREVAIHNIKALKAENYDYIVCLCASCVSHFQHNYENLISVEPDYSLAVTELKQKMITFSVFMTEVLKVDVSTFTQHNEKVTFHSPCHLGKGMHIFDQPINLIKKTGAEFVKAEEEQTCCGFGGSYSVKFTAISDNILKLKLDDIEKTEATTLVTECPGCVMQLRSGAEKRNSNFKVKHLAEFLAESKIKKSE